LLLVTIKKKKIVKAIWDTPIAPMTSVDSQVRTQIANSSIPDSEARIVMEHIEQGLRVSNINSAEKVHVGSVITSQGVVGTSAFLGMKIDGNFFSPLMQTLGAVIYGFHLGGILGRYVVEPVTRTVVDTFRARQQKRMINDFFRSEGIR